MEEGQPGSPKDFNRTGNPAIGTLSWQSFQERDPTGYRKLVTSVMRDDFTKGIKYDPRKMLKDIRRESRQESLAA